MNKPKMRSSLYKNKLPDPTLTDKRKTTKEPNVNRLALFFIK